MNWKFLRNLMRRIRAWRIRAISIEPIDFFPQWRQDALGQAESLYQRDVVDGTERGNRIIGEDIIGCATGRPLRTYHQGAVSWCGYFVQCCHRAAGFNPSLSIASVGKALYVFGGYRAEALQGSPEYVLDVQTGKIERIQSLHARLGDMRKVRKWPCDVTPGDILLHQSHGWHGHVMMVDSVNVETVTIVEGNSSRTVGPDGQMRDGVGKRTMSRDDDYLDYAVIPSSADFDDRFAYFSTKAAAKKARVERYGE